MNRDSGHHLRGTYIIDPNGVVRHVSMNDPPVGRNVDEYLRLIQAFQVRHLKYPNSLIHRI